MRQMSFMLTTAQVLDRSKTVTRRLGWTFAKVGDLVQPIEKGQGLEKGEKVRTLGGPIRLTAVDRVALSDIDVADVVREGFPAYTPGQFVRMFTQANACRPETVVTRIAFEYVEAEP